VEAQNLLKQIHEQVLQNVQDFYGKSLGSLESQLGEHRSQLLELQKQLADSQEDIRAQIGQLVASYEAIEKSLQETAREQGVEEMVSQAVQQAQVAAGRTAQQAQEAAGDKRIGLMGANVDQQFLAAGLVDEIRIHLVNVLLGGGRRLFDRLPQRIELEQTGLTETDGVTHLAYRVVR
jgi:riboflavin biosynthesis pyrimidine reductase